MRGRERGAQRGEGDPAGAGLHPVLLLPIGYERPREGYMRPDEGKNKQGVSTRGVRKLGSYIRGIGFETFCNTLVNKV